MKDWRRDHFGKLLENGTEVMVLQLPLDNYSVPKLNRLTSHEQFIAVQETFLDPLCPFLHILLVQGFRG